MAIWVLCSDSVRMAIHFFVNFDFLNRSTVFQSKTAWITPNLGVLWISVCSFWLCGSIVANPIIYRLVFSPFRLKSGNVACVWPPCCNMLRVENRTRAHDQAQHCSTWPNNHNIMQHPRMLREKFDHFQICANNTSQHGGQMRATCCAQQCCDMLRSNVRIAW